MRDGRFVAAGWSELGDLSNPANPLVETLAEALRSKEMLLVMDNCEHRETDDRAGGRECGGVQCRRERG